MVKINKYNVGFWAVGPTGCPKMFSLLFSQFDNCAEQFVRTNPPPPIPPPLPAYAPDIVDLNFISGKYHSFPISFLLDIVEMIKPLL
jgi:hypothetical protein